MVTTLKYGSHKDSLSKLLDRMNKRSRKGINVKKYAGKLQMDKDPVKIQKEFRDEWE